MREWIESLLIHRFEVFQRWILCAKFPPFIPRSVAVPTTLHKHAPKFQSFIFGSAFIMLFCGVVLIRCFG
ncbi:hypothetical protein P8452_55883 [Trifolium repens]|nr:hypothetical protein P8452_55883 [Trifolium repens]